MLKQEALSSSTQCFFLSKVKKKFEMGFMGLFVQLNFPHFPRLSLRAEGKQWVQFPVGRQLILLGRHLLLLHKSTSYKQKNTLLISIQFSEFAHKQTFDEETELFHPESDAGYHRLVLSLCEL